MLPQVTSLYQSPPGDSSTEHFNPLLRSGQLRLEQIISYGQSSPVDFWYDQSHPEWVALLRGTARLEFIDGKLTLGAGDALLIPAHCRHRVADCSTDAIWLALHLPPGS